MSDLGDKIKQRRDELGLTQEDLAQLLGYKSRSTIAKIESGKNDIPKSKIPDFANALKVTPVFLMGWEDFNDNLIKIQLRSIETWSNNKFLSPEERNIIKMHFADLLIRYKALINKVADSKFLLKDFEKHYNEYNSKLENPLTENQIKELFWKEELEKTIDDTAGWMKTFTSYLSGVYPIPNPHSNETEIT